MRIRIVDALAFREMRVAMRGRWFFMGSVMFGLLAIAVSQLGMGASSGWGISAADRTAAALFWGKLLAVARTKIFYHIQSIWNFLEFIVMF